MAVRRTIYMVLGLILTALALLGVVVPGLPVTPFILLASWLFLRSSKYFHSRLIASPLGKYVEDYQSKGGLSRNGKLFSILLTILMCGVSALFFISALWLQVLVACLGLAGATVIWFFVPTAKDQFPD